MEVKDAAAGVSGQGHSGDRGLARRRETRQPVHRRAHIVFGTRQLDVVMLDVSVHGAQCRLHVPAELPLLFELRQADGAARTVALRWKRGDRFGVAFINDAQGDASGNQQRAAGGLVGKIDALRLHALNELIHELNGEGHFARNEVRVAARDVALAIDRLKRAVMDGMKGQTGP